MPRYQDKQIHYKAAPYTAQGERQGLPAPRNVLAMLYSKNNRSASSQGLLYLVRLRLARQQFFRVHIALSVCR